MAVKMRNDNVIKTRLVCLWELYLTLMRMWLDSSYHCQVWRSKMLSRSLSVQYKILIVAKSVY